MVKIGLKIEYFDGDMLIPFKHLEYVDMFTRGFDSEEELYHKLQEIFDIDIDYSDVFDIIISYEFEEKHTGSTRVTRLPIMFSKDNYDKDDIKRVLAEYYKADHQRIRTHKNGIRNIKYDSIIAFIRDKNGKDIDNSEIQRAVNAYFSKKGYKVYRDIYFFLLKNGYPIKKNKNSSDSDDVGIDLRKYFGRGYLPYGQDYVDKIIEELSLCDIDMLKREFPGLFDGTHSDGSATDYDIDDVTLLEFCTGMNIDDLKSVVEQNLERPYRGRK